MPFLRKSAERYAAVAKTLREAGEQLFTFTRSPPSQWKSARTTNAVERLPAEVMRRIKPHTKLPQAETPPMLFWALLESGEFTMRNADDRQTLNEPIADQPIDLAAAAGDMDPANCS